LDELEKEFAQTGDKNSYSESSIPKSIANFTTEHIILSDAPNRIPDFIKNLVETLKSVNKELASKLCQELISYIYRTDKQFPERDAAKVLQRLRKKRYLDLTQRVGDTFILSGQQALSIRREYVQSLLDQGTLSAALNLLKSLLNDARGNLTESAQLRGLIGS